MCATRPRSNRAIRWVWARVGWLHVAIALLAIGVALSPATPGAATTIRRDTAATPMPRAFLPLVRGAAIDPVLQHDWQFAEQQIAATTRVIATTSYPATTNSSGGWITTGPDAWPSGFFPGRWWRTPFGGGGSAVSSTCTRPSGAVKVFYPLNRPTGGAGIARI